MRILKKWVFMDISFLQTIFAAEGANQHGALMLLLMATGALGIFLFGMKIMSDGLQKIAGEKLRSIMGQMTGNRFKGVLSGCVVTGAIQSSTATTVMVVSFVNAGLLKLREAIGVIMGANLGTTLTAWIIALIGSFSISAIALPIIGLGMILSFFKRQFIKNFGEFTTGFGLLFLGLDFLKKSVPDLTENPEALSWIQGLTQYGFGSVLIFLVLGFILTLLVHSSAVAIAITMTAAANGWLGVGDNVFQLAAAIVLGENIGTTITAVLAGSTGNTNAKRAAMAHLTFNMIGVVWVLAVFPYFTQAVNYLVDLVYSKEIAAASGDPTALMKLGLSYKLSLFHTMFNFANIIVLVGFVPQIEKLVCFLVKGKPNEKQQSSSERLEYLSAHFNEIGELCLFEGQKEVVHLAEMSTKMFDGFTDLFQKPDIDMSDQVNYLRDLEEECDKLSYALTNFFVQCTSHELSEASTSLVVKNMIIVAELEDMSDCCYRLITLARKRYRKQFKYQMLQSPAFVGFCDEMDQFLLYAHRMLLQQQITQADLDNAQKIRAMLDKTRKSIRREVITAIEEGGSARSGILFIEILGQCEKVGAHAMNILEALQNPAMLFTGSNQKKLI